VATQTLLTANNHDSDLSSYATASVSPGANELITVMVLSRAVSGTTNAPTLSGNGLTYVQEETGVDGNRVSCFRAMGASPSAGAITIDFAGQTQMYCYWKVVAWGSVDTGGTNGSAAVVQSVFAKDTATNAGLTITLAAFGSASNATYGAVRAGEAITPGSGFTEISESTGDAIFEDQWKNSSDTSVDWSWTSNGAFALGIAIEIKTATSTTYTQSLPVTALGVLALTKVRTVVKSLSQTATAVLSLTKAAITVKALALTATAAPALAKSITYLKHLVVGGGAATAGPSSPGTLADDATVGTVAWTNPSNAAASDNSRATAGFPGGSLDTTHYLKASDFGFSIPATATIDGITVETERSRSAFGADVASTVRLRIIKSGSVSSTELTDSYTWTTTDTYVTSGGSSNLWGETWTPSNINSSSFGVVLYTELNLGRTLQIDHVRITIHYTEPTSGAQAVVSLTKGLLRLSNLAVTVAAVLALSQIRTYLKSFTTTAAGSVLLSLVSTFARALTQTATAVVSLTPAATFYRALSVTASAVLDLAQQFISGIVSIGLSVTATASVNFSRLISLSKSVTAAASVSLVRTRFIILSTSATAVLAILKTIHKTLTAFGTGTASIAKGLLYERALAATALAAISFAKTRTVLATLAVSAIAVATLAKGLLYLAALTVSAVAVTSLSRVTTHLISLTVSALARLKLYVNGLASRYSQKYPAQGSDYTSKYPAQGTTYESKYPAQGTSYEEKYPT
jgi:hypothetical protein